MHERDPTQHTATFRRQHIIHQASSKVPSSGARAAGDAFIWQCTTEMAPATAETRYGLMTHAACHPVTMRYLGYYIPNKVRERSAKRANAHQAALRDAARRREGAGSQLQLAIHPAASQAVASPECRISKGLGQPPTCRAKQPLTLTEQAREWLGAQGLPRPPEPDPTVGAAHYRQPRDPSSRYGVKFLSTA